MEMFIVDSETNDDEETLITSFCFAAVTLLGNSYTPAIPNAKAIVEKYSKYNFDNMINKTKKILFGEKADISINIDTPKNKTQKKEEKKLEKFNKEEYLKKFSMTANEMMEKMYSALSGYKCKDGEYEYEKYYVRDFCNKYVYCRDYEENTMVAIPYSFSNKQALMDMGNIKYAYMRYVVDEDAEEKVEADVVQMYVDSEVKKVAEKFNKDLEAKINETKEAITNELTKKSAKEIKTYETKIDELNEQVKELTTFKENVLKQEKENKINYAINSVKDSLTEDQIKE
jgi:hypothetical protein